MLNKYGPFLFLILFGLTLVLKSTFFIVTEGKQVIVTQFGRPIGKPISDAGLKTKFPFIQDVRIMEKRILNWDGRPTEMTTRDKKTITVDTTARWRIEDSLLFIKRVQNERNAISRIDDILEGETREIISKHNLVEAVRNSNSILDNITAKQEQNELNDEISGEILEISQGREKLSKIIVQQASESLKTLGIELIDLQLRRIAYEETAEAAVFKRMISERVRIAEKLRSEGKGEAAGIRGQAEKELQEIESEAYRKSQKIKGEADAEAIRIYAEAVTKSPEFYEFFRTLEAYKQGIRKNSKFIMSSKAKFFELLNQGPEQK